MIQRRILVFLKASVLLQISSSGYPWSICTSLLLHQWLMSQPAFRWKPPFLLESLFKPPPHVVWIQFANAVKWPDFAKIYHFFPFKRKKNSDLSWRCERGLGVQVLHPTQYADFNQTSYFFKLAELLCIPFTCLLATANVPPGTSTPGCKLLLQEANKTNTRLVIYCVHVFSASVHLPIHFISRKKMHSPGEAGGWQSFVQEELSRPKLIMKWQVIAGM